MTFANLLEALSKTIGVPVEDAGGAAAINVDGTTIILQDAGELLLIRADLGEIPQYGREALLASAMEANFLYQGTGGSTLALNPDDGHLNIHKYNWLERLDPESTFNLLENFADTVNAWSNLIEDYRPVAQASSERPEDTVDHLGNDDIMKV